MAMELYRFKFKASQDDNGKWTINGIEAKDINSIQISHDKSVTDVESRSLDRRWR